MVVQISSLSDRAVGEKKLITFTLCHLDLDSTFCILLEWKRSHSLTCYRWQYDTVLYCDKLGTLHDDLRKLS